MFERKLTRQISVGKIKIGGGARISIQSMTNTKTQDATATIEQIQRLAAEGCDIVRVAVPDMTAAGTLGKIISAVEVPIVADIHFDYKLALESIAQGVAALRLNPGNIGGAAHVREVVKSARSAKIPIRIGVNAGSLSRKLLAKYGGATPEALVESALEHVAILGKSIFVRPQVGQAIKVTPPSRRPSDFRISLATLTSTSGFPVSETRIVSPIPSANNAPIPTADFMTPVLTVPASVMPTWSG